ncbi:MAG: 16S rRNA (adenine(1518)-N(6)/adenine(1519)-N(6))-dimethyltransferase RsmA [Candidatus Methanospirareceae archaeon]
MDITQLKELLRRHDIRLLRKLDQHFLIDHAIIERMIEYGEVNERDIVLEIGAGVGNITEELEKKAKKVYAIEKDRRLCDILRERCDRGKTEVIEGDFMEIELPKFDKVIANIPYSLSSQITYKLLLHGFNLAILIYQKEFAMKMVAKPKEEGYGRLAVVTQALAKVEILEKVPGRAFYPESVESMIVRLKEKMEMGEEEKKFLFDFVSAAFMRRRKKLRKVIEDLFGGEFKELDLEKLERRPEELSPEDFISIVEPFFIKERFIKGKHSFPLL